MITPSQAILAMCAIIALVAAVGYWIEYRHNRRIKKANEERLRRPQR